jgi:ADP-L-glycero-D-manno-heptose 6-epimerase
MADSHTYVVTGGAGFIGSNLVAELVTRDADARVIVVDDFSSGTFTNIVEAMDRRRAGIFRGEVVASACDECDWDSLLEEMAPTAVFHLAAITDTTVADERRMIESNAEAFRPILDACTQTATRLVYASSAATYGAAGAGSERRPLSLDDAGRPSNVYGFSKWLMECDHRTAAAQYREETGQAPWVVGLRFFNVFGPGEARKGKMASMAFQLSSQLLAEKRPRLFADGSQARDQIHVDDVVACTMAGAGLGQKKRPTPGVYNVGSGRATSFAELAAAVRRGFGLNADTLPVEYFPMPPDIRAFYQDYTCADMSQTATGLGFSPRVDPIEGIETYARQLSSARRARHASTT